MNELMKLARCVATELEEYDAQINLAPEYNLRELEEMRVVVVPHGIEVKNVTRTSVEETYTIQVGLMKRCPEGHAERLMNLLTAIGGRFLRMKFFDVICTSVVFNPIYSPEHLRSRNEFVGVMELVFKRTKRHDRQG